MVVLSADFKNSSSRRSTPRLKRLAKEVYEVEKDKLQSGIAIAPANDGAQLDNLEATMTGPEGTVYAGGLFRLSVKADERYPFTPLQVKFISKIYHPNVSSQTGAICLSTLTQEQWSPVLTVRTTLLSVQQLLSSPEPSDPIDAQVAKHYIENREDFEATARFWTEVYANGPATSNKPAKWSPPEQSLLDQCVAMGFDKDAVEKEMKGLKKKGDVTEDRLIESLLGGS